MSHVHHGRVFHVAGRPAVTGAAAVLVSITDGALVIDDGGLIVYCGERRSLPTEFDDAKVHDHRPGFLLPGLVGTLGGARALDMESRFGNVDGGKEADFVVVDPVGTPALDGSVSHGIRSSESELAGDQTLFAFLMGIRKSSIVEVDVQSRNVTAN